MDLKYGNSKTYQHFLNKEELDWLSSKVNRSTGQIQFLYNLVNGDITKLYHLEEQIKNCHVGCCPGTTEEVNYILYLNPNKKWFINLSQQRHMDKEMKFFAQNISEFNIDQEVIDNTDKSVCKITDKTLNSIEVFIPRKIDKKKLESLNKTISIVQTQLDKDPINEKLSSKLENLKSEKYIVEFGGINAKQWFNMSEFNKRFAKSS